MKAFTRHFYRIFIILTLIFGASMAMAAPLSPLQKFCAVKTNNDEVPTTVELSPFEQQLIFIQPSTAIDFCKNTPQLILNNGALLGYKLGKTYFFAMVDRDKKIKDIYVETFKNDFSVSQASIPMDDGIQIPTLILRPVIAGKKTFSTIFNRSPYLSKDIATVAKIREVNSGMAVVIQPARGTSTAPGEFEWLNWKQEAKDANATLNWISQQTWSDGNIYAMGVSYDGFLALATATTNHPNLKAVFAASAPWNPSADSLSANGTGTRVLKYTAGLNWDGNTRPEAITKLADESPNYDDLLVKARRTFGVQLNSMSPDQLARKSEDFIATLKNTKAIMVYGYGYHGDQDSRDVINLAHQIQGLKNHYFVVHNYGHSDFVLSKLLEDLTKDPSTQNLKQKITDRFKGKSSCSIYVVDKDENEENKELIIPTCSDNISKIYKAETVVLTSNEPLQSNGGILYAIWSYKFKHTLLGQRLIKLKITAPKDGIMIAVNTANDSGHGLNFDETVGNYPHLTLKAGTHEYEIQTQHEYFDLEAKELGFIIEAIDSTTYRPVKNQKFTLESAWYVLPVRK